MKKKERKLEAESILEPSLGNNIAEQPPNGASVGKKKSLLEKCDDLSEVLLSHKNSYQQILSTMADSNNKLVEDTQRQIRALKENLSGPERKKIKKAKLVDALADLQKAGNKLKLQPELGRKKDLEKVDKFLLKTFRVLDSMNDKFLNLRESSEQDPSV